MPRRCNLAACRRMTTSSEHCWTQPWVSAAWRSSRRRRFGIVCVDMSALNQSLMAKNTLYCKCMPCRSQYSEIKRAVLNCGRTDTRTTYVYPRLITFALTNCNLALGRPSLCNVHLQLQFPQYVVISMQPRVDATSEQLQSRCTCPQHARQIACITTSPSVQELYVTKEWSLPFDSLRSRKWAQRTDACRNSNQIIAGRTGLEDRAELLERMVIAIDHTMCRSC